MTSHIPCRVNDADSPDIMVMAFGPVASPLQQACFDAEEDRIIMNSGRVINDYYRQELGVKYYRPMAKSVFPKCPSGWCSWPYYGRDVTPEEVLLNAGWIRDNLGEYGVSLILLDDGWQADMRDWEGLRASFSRGMAWLAREIKSMGFIPGLWICPHGQDNRAFVEKTGGFMDCKTFGGPFTVDPTSPKGIDYLLNLTGKITREWGYAFLKLDGIHFSVPGYGVLECYRQNQKLFADLSVSGDEAFRKYLGAVTAAAGPDVFVGGCGVLCLESAGLCHGNRTGNDTNPELRNGFLNSLRATMSGYYLHRIAWYSDPDCCLVRPPLAFATARSWVSLFGLTGQMLFLGDRLPDLSPERVDLLKTILPSAAIVPFDLFPASRLKRIFDLKVNHLGRAYDVVGLFNIDAEKQRCEYINFHKLGLEGRFHVYDFWASEYLGIYEKGLFLEVPPAGCRVITLYPEGAFPALISTSRHIVQGWPDIQKYEECREAYAIKGTSRVIAGESYLLSFAAPVSGNKTFTLDHFSAGLKSPCQITSGRGFAQVRWTPGESGLADWSAVFKEVEIHTPHAREAGPYWMGTRDIDPWTVEISWSASGSPAAYCIRMDGQLLGYAFSNRVLVSGLAYKSRHDFEVGAADLNGWLGTRTQSISVITGESLPPALYLSDLPLDKSETSRHLPIGADCNLGGMALVVGGKRYGKGIGACPDSKVRYILKGDFCQLTGGTGIDDFNPNESAPMDDVKLCFRILGDGRELWSATIGRRKEPLWFQVDLQSVHELDLIVDGMEENLKLPLPLFADWLDLKVSF